MRQRGFTLLELLLAIAILAMITSIVYAVFASVVNANEMTRAEAEAVRLRQFLERSFERNFSTVYTDEDYADQAYALIGVDEDGFDGPQDTIRFTASSPVNGGLAFPGDVKEVRYEFIDAESEDFDLQWMDERRAREEEGGEQAEQDEEEPQDRLQVVETPLLAGDVQAVSETSGNFVTPETYESPSWTVPVRTFDVQYFDGTDWVKEWDSTQLGRMPWSVRVRINFAKTEEQLEKEDNKYDINDDPDFEMIVPVPIGIGNYNDLREPQDTQQGP